MSAPVSPTASAGDEARQAEALRVARRNATGLLALVAVAFVAALQLPDTSARAYAVAALQAGLVGGLTDWFAVVALFRHPLGIPIPHTAVIARGKDGLGRNLGGFVRDNFLSADRVEERLVDPERLDRVGRWLQDREHADRVAVEALRFASATAAQVDRDRLVPAVAEGARHRLAALPVSHLLGDSIEGAAAGGARDRLVSAITDELDAAIDDHRDPLRARLAASLPPWVPGGVADLVFERVEDVARGFLHQVRDDPDHEVRQALDAQVASLVDRLRHDERMSQRVELAVRDVVTQELVERWVDAAWTEVLAALERSAEEAGEHGTLRTLAVDALVEVGHRLVPGGGLHDRAREVLASLAPRIADVGQREVVTLVTRTVDTWDAEDTARRLELWLGRDLQFVRVNGTLVGALVGVVLHAATQAF